MAKIIGSGIVHVKKRDKTAGQVDGKSYVLLELDSDLNNGTYYTFYLKPYPSLMKGDGRTIVLNGEKTLHYISVGHLRNLDTLVDPATNRLAVDPIGTLAISLWNLVTDPGNNIPPISQTEIPVAVID